MKSLTELFKDVSEDIIYTTVGEGVDYCLLYRGSTLYIYFEPSDGKIDWKHNFMFAKRPYKDMKEPYRVHRGFLKCWKYVEDIIIDAVKNPDIEEIITVGYSHGGALAMLCHECCWYHRPDIRDSIWGIGFDTPRVYAGFRVRHQLKKRWKQFLVIRNHTDLVTHLPPTLFGYSHVGEMLKIGKKAKYGCIKSHFPDKILKSLEECPYNENWKSFF